MARLSVFMPVKPLWINQAFGIFNPAYKQFGFTRHNGVDFQVVDGQLAYAMCDGYVTDEGQNAGAGKYVRFRTAEPVEAEGRTGVVEFVYMHARKTLVKKGQYLKAGDVIMECDNTGFSTGHHLHVSAYFVSPSGKKLRVGSKETDYCFDFMPYWNKYFAVDAQRVLSILYKILALLKAQKPI